MGFVIIPGGDILTSKERIVLEPTGNFESIKDLRRTVIKLPDRKNALFLRDLAHIYRGYIDPSDMKMYSSGLPCLGIALNLREGRDILRMGKEVKITIKRLQGVYPIGSYNFLNLTFYKTYISLFKKGDLNKFFL